MLAMGEYNQRDDFLRYKKFHQTFLYSPHVRRNVSGTKRCVQIFDKILPTILEILPNTNKPKTNALQPRQIFLNDRVSVENNCLSNKYDFDMDSLKD